MKFCTKCGAKLNNDDLFCSNCGQKCDYMMPPKQQVEEPAPQPVLEEPKEEPVVENVPQEEEVKSEPAPQQDEPVSLEDNKKPLTFKDFFKPAIKGKEMNDNLLIKRGIIFTAILLGLSVILWSIGAFVNIHVAIRIVVFLLALGACVLPTIDAVLLVIYFIKNKKFILFITIVLAICLTLLYTLMSLQFSYILSL